MNVYFFVYTITIFVILLFPINAMKTLLWDTAISCCLTLVLLAEAIVTSLTDYVNSRPKLFYEFT